MTNSSPDIIITLGLCVSILGFIPNVLSRRVLVFILVALTSTLFIIELALSHNIWMIGDQGVVLARSTLAIILLRKNTNITTARWHPYTIGIAFGLVSFALTLWLRNISEEQVSTTNIALLSISTTIATTGFYMRNVLLLKIYSLLSYIPWVILLIVRGLYGNLLGSFLSCLFITWSLYEIVRARKHGINYQAIEQANLPWKIRTLHSHTPHESWQTSTTPTAHSTSPFTQTVESKKPNKSLKDDVNERRNND